MSGYEDAGQGWVRAGFVHDEGSVAWLPFSSRGIIWDYLGISLGNQRSLYYLAWGTQPLDVSEPKSVFG